MKKILIIEDDTIVCENTSEILELANYNVKTADNGKKGVLLAKEFMPDLIICDILMPELDGYGVLQILSKTPELESIPFIFLTAKTHYEDLRKGMDLGADDYLTKPIEESELLRAIDSRLKRVVAFEQKIGANTNKPKNFTSKNVTSDFKYFLKNKEFSTYKKGDVLFYKGNISDSIFIVKEGLVKTFHSNSSGKELITGLYTDNQIFGYVSFALHIPNIENAKALSNSSVYKVKKSEIAAFIKKKPQILYYFIDIMATNLYETNNKQLLMSYGSVREKTAIILIHLLEKFPNHLSQKIVFTRADLAGLVGIAKETLIRTLHDFNEEKLIKINKKGIEVIDLPRLRKVM